MPLRKARILITEACPRACPGCCNKYPRIMSAAKVISWGDFGTLRQDYDEVMITGGEPLLIPALVRAVARTFKPPNSNYKTKVFLYTTMYPPEEWVPLLMPVLDGVQFSMHYPSRIEDYNALYQYEQLADEYRAKSFRLFVDNRVTMALSVYPPNWQRVVIGPWKTEEQLLQECPNGGLPEGEEMFIVR